MRAAEAAGPLGGRDAFLGGEIDQAKAASAGSGAQAEPSGEKPQGQENDATSATAPACDETKDAEELPGYEQADHLKGQGKDKFARGEVSEAVTCWLQALESLPPPASGPRGLPGMLGLLPQPEEPQAPKEDHRILELRVALLLNLALAHSKLKKFRQAVGFCEEALLDEPESVKALYRKADALGELCDWQVAEEAAAKLEATGAEGAKLAAQKREEWKRRQRQADGKQKKMWSAALEKKAQAKEPPVKVADAKSKAEILAWSPPKLEMMSPFDLRKKTIVWEEEEDFNDKIWKESLGRKEAAFFQKQALPLSLVAAAALADLELTALSELVVHCILDGNVAPFAEPHDWSILLKRCPEVRNVLVVYIDIGAVGVDKDGQPPQPYGTLLRPTEEGRVGERVARSARFMGTYDEFLAHCKDLPGLVRPGVALWADVPLYGFNDDDFAIRLQAISRLSAAGITSVITMGGEVQEPGGFPLAYKLDEQAKQSIAVLSIATGMKKLATWQWNRFVVPLDRGPQGILAGHAVLGVLGPGMKSLPNLQTVKDALKKRGVALTPFKLPLPPGKSQSQEEEKFAEMRDKQWQAFCKHLQSQGRQVATAQSSEEEKRRQTMEWYQYIGGSMPAH
ncbi:unnamed protein product [Effrenium voratum]|nr:unnamed protein product [Effrenium voratum]